MEGVLGNILAALIAYLLGCLAFSYLIVKAVTKQNIINIGSGNTGAMNSYETTGKRWIGIVVFLLDVLKGFIACFIAYMINSEMFTISLAGVFVVLGHNFNIFFRLKGGRGLASTTGVLLFVNPLAVILWAFLWVVSYYGVRKNVHVANSLATVCVPILLIITPEQVADIFKLFDYENYIQYIQLVIMMGIIIFLKHIEPLRELIDKKKLFNE